MLILDDSIYKECRVHRPNEKIVCCACGPILLQADLDEERKLLVDAAQIKEDEMEDEKYRLHVITQQKERAFLLPYRVPEGKTEEFTEDVGNPYCLKVGDYIVYIQRLFASPVVARIDKVTSQCGVLTIELSTDYKMNPADEFMKLIYRFKSDNKFSTRNGINVTLNNCSTTE